MTKFLIASVAIFGFAGVASAQQAPALYGSNYDAAVRDSYSPAPAHSGSMMTGSASAVTTTDRAGAGVDGSVNINQLENYSGR